VLVMALLYLVSSLETVCSGGWCVTASSIESVLHPSVLSCSLRVSAHRLSIASWLWVSKIIWSGQNDQMWMRKLPLSSCGRWSTKYVCLGVEKLMTE
jgi:hypothetical protein